MTTSPDLVLPSAPSPLLGYEVPRLYTPPLRELTPETSLGFAVIAWSLSRGRLLLPWQCWFLIHALELLEDGTLRFKILLLLVSRQNGKTTVFEALTDWVMHHREKALVLGLSTSQELAREPWSRVTEIAEDNGTAARVTRGAIDTSLWLKNGSRYKVAAANRRAGRSLSVDLLLVDELREHLDDEAWAAAKATTTAKPHALTAAMSNAGDDRSVVLNTLRAQALTAGPETKIFIAEWSAPEGCELDDLEANAQANPSLGYLIAWETLETALASMTPARYRTEHLCQAVATENPAVDRQGWEDCTDAEGTMDGLRDRVILTIEASLTLDHLTLLATAPLDDGRVRAEVVQAWDSSEALRRDLPGLLERIKPRLLGWCPSGPMAALAPDLKAIPYAQELTATEVTASCQALADFVLSRRLLHPGDPLLTAQTMGASKTVSGDGWRFTRRGVGACDSTYALAMGVHLARTVKRPAPVPIFLAKAAREALADIKKQR